MISLLCEMRNRRADLDMNIMINDVRKVVIILLRKENNLSRERQD
jgi:hypothetical protein